MGRLTVSQWDPCGQEIHRSVLDTLCDFGSLRLNSRSRCNVADGDSAKGGAVGRCKTSELHELMILGDLRDACCRRIGVSERRAGLVQTSQQKISCEAYAE